MDARIAVAALKAAIRSRARLRKVASTIPTVRGSQYASETYRALLGAFWSETTGFPLRKEALAFPWEKWGVFLLPSQRALVERSFSGPARVAGSAGTGKTIVAIHRAVRFARENPNAKVLLVTFSDPLAAELAKNMLVLAPETGGIVPRITTASFKGIAEQMFQLERAGGADFLPRQGANIGVERGGE
jgi:hypothetical protein